MSGLTSFPNLAARPRKPLSRIHDQSQTCQKHFDTPRGGKVAETKSYHQKEIGPIIPKPKNQSLPQHTDLNIKSLTSRKRSIFFDEAVFQTERPTQFKRRATLSVLNGLPCSANHHYRISVFLEENWGHPSMITISEIDFLDSGRAPMMVLKVTSNLCNDGNSAGNTNISEMHSKKEDFFKLYNSYIIKQELKDLWSTSWFEDHPPIELVFEIISYSEPKEIRIWNAQIVPESGIRQISVSCNGQKILSAEIPRGFGSVLSLKNPEIPVPIVPYDPGQPLTSRNEFLRDSYGFFKLSTVFQAKLEAISTIVPSSPYVGLNNVEFFDINGRPVPYKMFTYVANVKVNHSNQSNQPDLHAQSQDEFHYKEKLSSPLKDSFWNQKSEAYLELGNIGLQEHLNDVNVGSALKQAEIGAGWIRTKGQGSFEFVFNFARGAAIALIRINNYKGAAFNSGIGIRKVKVTVNKTICFIGPLNKEITNIWVVDSDILEHDPTKHFILGDDNCNLLTTSKERFNLSQNEIQTKNDGNT